MSYCEFAALEALHCKNIETNTASSELTRTTQAASETDQIALLVVVHAILGSVSLMLSGLDLCHDQDPTGIQRQQVGLIPIYTGIPCQNEPTKALRVCCGRIFTEARER